MPVFRVERNKGYTVMSNYHLRDKSLSLKAKGLLSQILSLPEDWDYTLSGLCYINRESKDAIRSAVNELERAGYIERYQATDEGGKFSISERTARFFAAVGKSNAIKLKKDQAIIDRSIIHSLPFTPFHTFITGPPP